MDTFVSMSIFRRVVETGSFSAVARETGLSQPTISKHVIALEERLGARLLNRSTRQLNLTEAGKEHYEYCTRILDELAEAEASVGRGKSETAGTLRISMPIAFGRLQVVLEDYTPIPMAVHAAYPDRRFVAKKVRYFIEHLRNTLESSAPDSA